ncbi:MAG TPA: GntR family transcriptional regulator [Herpetosiphonaceae bacterium]
MQAHGVAQPRYRTKQEFVYQSLRESIMRGELKPGERLRIEDIAQRLGVSPIPVREALHMLQSERLVENIPHVGATVAKISKASIIEVFTVMEGLELVATRTAAQRLTSADRQRLDELLKAMDRAIESNAHNQWSDLNTEFHLAIVRITDMPMLQEMTERVLNQWDRVRRYYLKDVLVFRLVQAQNEHHLIVQAMAEHDYERLSQLVRAHNQGALTAYTEYLAHHVEPDNDGVIAAT